MKSDESLFWIWLAEAFGAGNGDCLLYTSDAADE